MEGGLQRYSKVFLTLLYEMQLYVQYLTTKSTLKADALNTFYATVVFVICSIRPRRLTVRRQCHIGV